MSERLRNMIAGNWNYLGDTRVGLPSEAIPSGSLLTAKASEFPDDLHRSYVTDIVPAAVVAEDGSISDAGSHAVHWDYYRNGILEEEDILSLISGGDTQSAGGAPARLDPPASATVGGRR